MNTNARRKDVPVLDVLLICLAHQNKTGTTPDVALAHRFPLKVIMARMEQLVDQGLLEYGVSMRTAWPTEKGTETLIALYKESLRTNP